MRPVGIVGDGSSDLEAEIILYEGEEELVKRDDILLVEDRYRRRFLVKIASPKSRDQTLKTAGPYSPGIALAQIRVKPSSAKRFTVVEVRNLGQVEGKSLGDKELLIPGSEAYAFDEENPMQMILETDITIGYYKRLGWRVPARPEFLSYHIGVFGNTGCGKSLLARSELIPFVLRAGYSLIVFDWKGTDFAPYYERGIVLKRVEERTIIFEDRPRTAKDIIELAVVHRVLVINEGKAPDEEKLNLFLRVGGYLWHLMTEGKKLHLAILIDEGPQYVPWTKTKLQTKVKSVLNSLCGLGRSYELPIIILSQGMAGDIGVDAAIRRNLNTQFIGKIHPLDMGEVDKLVGPQGLDVKVLAGLTPRMEGKRLVEACFYFLGSMNPSPDPLKIHFQPMDEIKGEEKGDIKRDVQAFM